MTVTPGKTYECDRVNWHTPPGQSPQTYSEFLPEGDSRINEWHKIERVTADGNTVSFDLCKECYRQYKEMAEMQDSEFNKWRLETD